MTGVQTCALPIFLVADDDAHAVLLRNKVVEAARSGRPILAIAPLGSTTGEVVRAAGGLVIEPIGPEQIVEGLRRFEGSLADGNHERPVDRRAMARLSPERIVNDCVAVMDYARSRFQWVRHPEGPEPIPPTVERWP